jgi:hypothetical protein
MVVLNLLNRLFGPKETLTRDEIDRYVSDPRAHQATEEKAALDEFDDTALEGWQTSGLDTSSMHQLDQRILGTANSSNHWKGKAAIGLLLLIGGAGLLLFWNTDHENNTPPVALLTEETEQEQEQERSDMELDSEIEQMTEVEATEQVQPEELVTKFASTQRLQREMDRPVTPANDPSTDVPAIDLSPVPQTAIETPDHTAKALIYQSAAEVYLHDLKLVDYRKYRSGTVKTERMQFSGTPANMDAPHHPTTEEITWKEVEVPYHDYLEKTMAIFSKRKYKQALQRFETILLAYPDDVNAHFYSALCLYNLGQYARTIDRLGKAYQVEFGNFYQEALWFKALSYEKLNNHQQAQQLFQRIVQEGGFYQAEAKKRLK